MKNFISNLDKRDKHTLIKAARQTSTQIVIQDNATDFNGNRIPGCVGIYSVTDEKPDTTDMWIKFQELKRRD